MSSHAHPIDCSCAVCKSSLSSLPSFLLRPASFAVSEQESILQEAHRLTHGDRQREYGHPLDDYTRTAALVSALLAHKLKEPLTAHDMALAMNCVKLSREVNCPKRDNRTDGAGYWWVADAIVEETERRKLQIAGQSLAQANKA